MKKIFFNSLKSALVVACVVLLTDCKKEPEAAPYSPPATNSLPVAYFTYAPATNLTAPVTINFTNGSKNADSYVWTYDGSGNTLKTTDISLVFNQAGTYTISLEATGKGGSDTYMKTITVTTPTTITKPVADFTYSPSSNLVAPQKIAFTSTSKNADTYKWDFGDGTTSSAASVTKEFTKAGDFMVKLTASDAKSQSDQKSVTISVKAATVVPTADYIWTASNLKATFTNTSKNASSYAWNFGDGTTSAATNPTHDFSKAGTYNVNLKASDGKTDAQTTKLVTVTAPATASCDWAAWNKLVTVTRFEYKNNFCSDGQTLVSIRNDANVNMDMQFCLQKADGSWKSEYGLDTRPGGWLIGPDSWTCGKAKAYKFWARPTSMHATCPYPSCN